MDSLKPERASKWAEARLKGKWTFVWRFGVLQWGLTMCGVFAGMQIAHRPSYFLFILGFNIPIWLCMGFLCGLFTWIANEWSYKHYAAKADSDIVG